MSVRFVAAIAALALGCSEGPSGPDITVNWIIVSTPDHRPAMAGGVDTLMAVVLGPNDQPVRAGVAIRWLLPAGGGSVEFPETNTDAQGIARVRWTPPTKTGEYDIGVVVVGLPTATVTTKIGVTPAEPARVTLAVDSLHFTRRAAKTVAIRVFDRFDNEHSYLPPELQLQSTAPIFAEPVFGMQLSVSPGSLVRSSGEVTLRTVSGNVLARLKVGVAIVIKSLQLNGIGDDGLTVGETLPVSYVARDSGDVTVTATPEQIGLTITADPARIAVTSDFKLTGVGAGTTELTIQAGDAVLHDTIDVVPGYDLGSRTTLYFIPGPFVGGGTSVIPYAPVLSAVGVSVLPVSRSYGSTLAWYDAQGTKLVERTWSVGNVVSAADRWHVGNPLTSFSSTGASLWAKQHSGAINADTGLVVVGTPSHVLAFSPAGDSLWSHATGSASAFQLAPSLVFVQKDSTVTALDRFGQAQWSIGSFSAKLTDESSAVYGMSGTQWRSYDQSGALRWTNDASGSKAVLGPDNSILLVGSGVRALDRITGQERWRTSLGYFANAVGVVGNRLVIVSARFLNVYDASSGTLLGRSVDRHQVSFTAVPLNAPVCTPAGLLFAAGAGYIFSRCP